MKRFTSKTQRTGELAEHIATDYLKKKGYNILERNFTCKLGEIDIVAERDLIIYFVEVKSAVTHESGSGISPEENFTRSKWVKMKKTMDMYFSQKSVSRATQATTLLIAVTFAGDMSSANIKTYRNIGNRFM
jgi:putative endonuclease